MDRWICCEMDDGDEGGFEVWKHVERMGSAIIKSGYVGRFEDEAMARRIVFLAEAAEKCGNFLRELDATCPGISHGQRAKMQMLASDIDAALGKSNEGKYPISGLQTPEGKAWAARFMAMGFRENELHFIIEPDGTELVTTDLKNFLVFSRRTLPPELVVELLARRGLVLSMEEECELFFGDGANSEG